ncbi:ComF family protein [Pseudomonas sp. IT-P176]|uniref:ComF family protein n=1 Tax=Pseudomonas sp. IT-P176 TaxID=3026444 RepID=UPI0039E09579
MVIREIPTNGAWDQAVSLDKHIVRSVPIGKNEQGYMQFDTERTEIGEAVFQLKYRLDFSKVEYLAKQIVYALTSNNFPKIEVVIPMPASKARTKQPVTEIARKVAELLNIDFNEQTLEKIKPTGAMKDLETYAERVAALAGCFEVRDAMSKGPWNALVIDDLYDTGASLEAACFTLRKYGNIRNISAIAITRRH